MNSVKEDLWNKDYGQDDFPTIRRSRKNLGILEQLQMWCNPLRKLLADLIGFGFEESSAEALHLFAGRAALHPYGNGAIRNGIGQLPNASDRQYGSAYAPR